MNKKEIGYIDVDNDMLEFLKEKFQDITFCDVKKGKQRIYNTIISGYELKEELLAFYKIFNINVICLYNSTIMNTIDLIKKSIRKKREYIEKELSYIKVINKYQHLNEKIEALVDENNNHSLKVAYTTSLFCERLYLEKDRQLDLYIAALMHDIGKTFISPEILCKKSKLTNKEFESIKHHSVKGYEFLKGELPEDVLLMIKNHHVRENGGYPETKEKVSQWSKLIALADSYDAMTSKRVYNTPIKKYEAINEILLCSTDENSGGKGILFDPYLTELFIKTIA
ncbi:MAG: HD domain-containing protein [Tenericutes bacterium]|nr:HD domain-containing protein [Mycoplasmatota bacterium]